MVSTPAPSLDSAQLTGSAYLPPGDATALSPNQSLMPLTAQVNSHHHLTVGGCDVKDLVQQFGSPLYILDEETLRTACRQYRDSFQRFYPGESQVLYASKAWNCLAVCAIVASEGLGLDVVSGGELYTAIQAGVDPQKIYLHGNNKSASELQLALDVGCTIVVDNWFELETLAQLATAAGKTPQQPQRVMVRFTPGIECHTHEYIRTGHLDSKFGFDPDQLAPLFQRLSQTPSLTCIGLHAHIGSQIFELKPHEDLAGVVIKAFVEAQAAGLPMAEVNIGGGLGIRYTESDDPPSIETWSETVGTALVKACTAAQIPMPKLLCEPGRSLIGSACVTAYTVGSRKEVPGLRTYLTVDGGMSDNPRPITYQSVYRAVVANRLDQPCTDVVTLAGKHCESGDVVIKEAHLPPAEPGDIVVVMATGAYNYSMASNYNRLSRPGAVVVQGGEASLILQRETYADLLRQDCLPERLAIAANPVPAS
ncbi:diaminopimelate decarboxylase [Prochlorothrix hollandica]|uniref:diaminopimelate decarboxylase n=1 Tax=Prochlorothrix hollandica TaxID=1223 RepID=UPI000475B2D6|nr:diaminopimelate decarboxylase [Prochlorothrix hollandica]